MPSRSQLKLWRSLRGRKGRAAHGLFLVEGPRVVAELMGSPTRTERVLYVPGAKEDPEVVRALALCREAGFDPEEVEEAELARLTATVAPQGLLAVARIPVWSWRDITPPRLLLLDRIQDPGNVGTLIRTAEALGLGGVVCLPGSAEPWSPKVTRAAAGSTLRLPVLCDDWGRVGAELADREIPLWTAEVGGGTFGPGDPSPPSLALALGSEAHGISPELAARAVRGVGIAMTGPVQSLNVSVAGAILMDRIFGRSGRTRG